MRQNVYKKNQLVLKELNLPSDVSLTLNKDVSKVGATNVNKVMRDLKGKNIGNGQLVVPVSGSTVDPQTNNGVSVVTGTDDLSNMRKAAENVKKIGGNKLVVQDGDVNNGVLSKSKTGSTSNAMGESVIFKKNDILEMIGGKKTRNRKLKEGIYDPYDDNEVFDIGKTNDYRVNWMFSDLSRWGNPKIVSQGQEEFGSMEECVEFIKKTAEESEKKSGHDLYATECKIEQKIGSLADDRWDNVCSYDGMYLHQIINSIQETNESVVFRKNEILEMIGGKKRSKKKV